MPVSYKQRRAMKFAATVGRRTRGSVNSRVARAVASMVGTNRSRQMVSIPAVMRSRGNMATEIKVCDGVDYSSAGGGTAITFTSAGSVHIIQTPPVEGSSFYNRIARRTRALSLEVRGFIKASNANVAAVPMQYARVIILYDRQPNGSLPSLATVLTDYTSAGAASNNVTSGLNMDNRDRFVVLRDRKLILPSIGANGVPSASFNNQVVVNGGFKDEGLNFSEYIKLKGLETQYKASTGAIGDIATGSFIIVVQSSVDTNATPAWNLDFTSRFKFFD